MKYVIIYLIAINVITMIMFGIDKRKAIKNEWRIPERTLFILAIIGGSIGGILGMHMFHHKTKKWYFAYGIPLILIIQIGSVIYLYK